MGNIGLMLIKLFVLAFIICDNVPSKSDALEKRFKAYDKKEIKEFEYEKSPLYTIFLGGTGTGETYFVKQ